MYKNLSTYITQILNDLWLNPPPKKYCFGDSCQKSFCVVLSARNAWKLHSQNIPGTKTVWQKYLHCLSWKPVLNIFLLSWVWYFQLSIAKLVTKVKSERGMSSRRLTNLSYNQSKYFHVHIKQPFVKELFICSKCHPDWSLYHLDNKFSERYYWLTFLGLLRKIS